MLPVMDYPATYVFTLCRLDALAAGAAMAVLFSAPQWRGEALHMCRRLAPFACIVLLITVLVPFSPSLSETRPWFFSVFGYSWLALSFAVLVGASLSAGGAWAAILKSRVLTFLGKRCYGLYLWHVVIAGCILAGLEPFQLGFRVHVFVWFVSLVIAASASWLLFEEPILRLKRFVPYEEKPPMQLLEPTGQALGALELNIR